MQQYRLGKRFAAVAIPPLVALCLLAGLIAERQSWPEPQDAGFYHESVREAVLAIPERVDTWQGETVDQPSGAIELLQPNVILSRRYRDTETQRAFMFLVIHCRDARDMLGHFPPACYPAQGWKAETAERAQWPRSGRAVTGRIYEFSKTLMGRGSRLNVVNLIVLPNGKFGYSMDDVHEVARNRSFRGYGAAQVQFVFQEDFSPAERRRVVSHFLEASQHAIETIRVGID